ncbi:MAG: trypsin-like peptidase domain-containing protein [Tenericutes bacterium]|nr:trypsin-like peptidase domain-containing protein [Mycoplasmatota bacterium]
MKLKKTLLLLLIVLLTPVLISCDQLFYFGFNTTTDLPITTTLPTLVNGTITYESEDYSSYPQYVSDTYSLESIDDYNDVLFNTQDYVRHANIELIVTLYEELKIVPWSTETERREVGISTGSGFIFMEDTEYYYAITNYHVIDPEEYLVDYELKAYGDPEFSECEVVVSDADIDLAVIRFLKAERTEITIIDIYQRLYYKFTPGELVMACGNPLEVNDIVTFGEYFSIESIQNVDYDVIYHNAQIDEGSSGGALVDVDGNLLGVNTWGLQSDDIYSFAIPNFIVYMFLINYGILET